MKTNQFSITGAGLWAVMFLPLIGIAADRVEKATIQKLAAGWLDRLKLALNQILVKYGEPQETIAMSSI